MKDRANNSEICKYIDGSASIISVECGQNKALLHLDKLCQGSKGACILFDDACMDDAERVPGGERTGDSEILEALHQTPRREYQVVDDQGTLLDESRRL